MTGWCSFVQTSSLNTLYPVVHRDTKPFSIFQSAEWDFTIIKKGSQWQSCQEVMWVAVVVGRADRRQWIWLTGTLRRIHQPRRSPRKEPWHWNDWPHEQPTPDKTTCQCRRVRLSSNYRIRQLHPAWRGEDKRGTTGLVQDHGSSWRRPRAPCLLESKHSWLGSYHTSRSETWELRVQTAITVL